MESFYATPANERGGSGFDFLTKNYNLRKRYVDARGRPQENNTTQKECFTGYQIAQTIAAMTRRENGTPIILLVAEVGLVISAFIATFLQADQFIPPSIKQFETHIKLGLIVIEFGLSSFAGKKIDNFIKVLRIAHKTGLSLATIRSISGDKSLVEDPRF